MKNTEFSITREKHLDHMVRVVPFIVTAYAIQCYFILQLGSREFGVNGLFFLGGMLISMICAFITYDLTHTVKFREDTLVIAVAWLGFEKEIRYLDMTEIKISDPGQSFSTIELKMKCGKKYRFYFVDDAEKIKGWLEEKRMPALKTAA